MNVLVVDDDAICRRSVALTLQAAGYQVSVARDGQEALEMLVRQGHQLVVSDREMPNMGGLEFCRAVRLAELGRYVYFILLTAHDQIQDTIDGLSAGADDYVTKPFHPGELVMRVNCGRRVIRAESSGLTIFALAKLAESRDPETGAHLERVRSYCQLLAQHLFHKGYFPEEIDDEYVRLIYETSPLHDIGKVAIPDAVLLKPGSLTQEEFDIMKTHAQHGANTLAAAMLQFPNTAFLRMAYEIALSHHERFNGCGYPQGLVGNAIPLCGRIVALADMYDAMTSKRVYKDATDHLSAKTVIINEKGKHFDPIVVEAFVALDAEFQAIRAKYASAINYHTLSIVSANAA